MRKRIALLLGALFLVTAIFAGIQYYVQSKVPEPVAQKSTVGFSQYLTELPGTDIPDEVAAAYIDELGFEETLATLTTTRPHCHSEAHALGRVLYNQSKDLGSAVMQCGRSCTDGCFHGVVMALFGNVGSHTHDPNEAEHDPHPVMTDENKDEIINTLLTLCNDESIKTMTNGRPGDCFHATGHAALFITSYDTDAALALCKQFTDLGSQHYCATGVFMERNGAQNAADNDVILSHPCEASTEFAAACYRYELQEIHDKKLATQEDVLAHCQSLTDPAHQRGCFHGYGFAYHYSVQTNLQSIATLCQHGDTIAQELCVEGAIGAAGNQIPESIADACAYLPDHLQTACMTGVRERSFGMNRDFSRYVNIDSER